MGILTENVRFGNGFFNRGLTQIKRIFLCHEGTKALIF